MDSEILSKEYQNFTLWYFISFIFGIAFYFKRFSGISWLLPFVILPFFYPKLVLFIFKCIIAFTIGSLVSFTHLSLLNNEPIKEKMEINMIGTVDEIKPTPNGLQILLVDISNQGDNLKKVRVNIANRLADNLQCQDRIKIRARLFPLPRNVLPDSYDFGFYMYMSGIQATGYTLEAVKIISKGGGYNIQNIRQKIYNRLIEVLGREGNIISAILIGKTNGIPENIAQNIRDAGIAHILCVSGLHLSLVAVLCFVAFRFLLNCFDYFAYNFNIKFLAGCLSIVFSFLYLKITGSNIAAVRAFILISISMLAIILGRNVLNLRALMISAIIILLINPEYVLHPSFQLSFAAVLCLVSGYRIYQKFEYKLGFLKGKGGILIKYIFINLYSSTLATIATAPFIIYHFYKIPTYSVITNLFAIPLMSFLIMPLGIISLILMPLGLDRWILQILGFIISIIINATSFIAKSDIAVINVGHIPIASLALSSFGLLWIFLWRSKIRLFGITIILFALFLVRSQETPDLIFDYQRENLVIMEANDLKIYGLKIPKFISNYLSNWYGSEIEVIESDISKANDIFIVNGHKIALSYSSCQEGEIEIITSSNLRCNKSKEIIYNQDFIKQNQILIYCDLISCIWKFNKIDELYD